MEQFTAMRSQQVAILIGVSLITMSIAAFFGVNGLDQIELGLTKANPILDVGVLKGSLIGWLVILIADILVAWGLYQLFETTDRGLSLLMAWLRMVYVVFLGIAMVFLIQCTLVDAVTIEDTTVKELMNLIQSFREVWSFGLIVFGLHLLGLGYLCLKTVFIHRLIGILIFIAGIGYLIVHIGHVVIANFDAYQSTVEMIFILPMIFGELGLAFWLLVKRKKLIE